MTLSMTLSKYVMFGLSCYDLDLELDGLHTGLFELLIESHDRLYLPLDFEGGDLLFGGFIRTIIEY